jgi:hypothetical protein
MLKAEAELKAQIEALFNKARAADEAERNEPELDIPVEIAPAEGEPQRGWSDARYSMTS